MVHHHPATLEDLEHSVVAGRMAISCPICVTRNAASAGPPVPSRVSTISSMEILPPACTMPHMRTAPWADPCQEHYSHWMHSVDGIEAPMPASRMSVSVPNSSASMPRQATVSPTDRQLRDPPVVMVTTVWMVAAPRCPTISYLTMEIITV